MKNQKIDSGSLNRLKKILSSVALCAMMTTNLAGAATYDVSTVAAKGIGDGLGTSDFNSIVDTLKGWVLDDNDTNDGSDDTATFAGDICNGSGDCLSDAMNVSAGGKFVDGTTAADAVFTSGNVGIGTDSPITKLQVYGPDIDVATNNTSTPVLRLSRKVLSGANGYPKDSAAEFQLSRWRSVNNNPETQMDIFLSASEHQGGSDSHTPSKEILSLRSDGNVGIGTTSPGAKLDVSNGSIMSGFRHGSSNMYGLLGVRNIDGSNALGGYAMEYGSGFESPIIFGYDTDGSHDNKIRFSSIKASDRSLETGLTDRMVVDMDNGNVGIGTDSPTSTLAVHGGDNENYAMEIVNGGGNGKGLDIRTGSAGVSQINASFRVASWDGVFEKFWVGNNGNVGIGTTNPTEKLEVAGNVKAGVGNFSDGLIVSRGSITPFDLMPSNDATVKWRIGTSSRDYAGGDFTISDELSGGVKFMIEKDSGNIGIGTTNPTEKLDVNGTAKVHDVLMEVKSDKGSCDTSSVGRMVYEEIGDEGIFYGCVKNGPSAYSWVNLQVFGQ